MRSRTPSRRMHQPPLPTSQPAPAWWKIVGPISALLMLLCGILWIISSTLPFLLIACGFILSMLVLVGCFLVKPVLQILERRESQRLMRLADNRPGESICTFVRRLDYRKLDTWIIRAVYEQLHEHKMGLLPIRPEDDFENVLRLDGEELEEIAEIAADLAGRSLEYVEDNPYNERINTVRDLVMFLHHMPPPRRGERAMWENAAI